MCRAHYADSGESVIRSHGLIGGRTIRQQGVSWASPSSRPVRDPGTWENHWNSLMIHHGSLESKSLGKWRQQSLEERREKRPGTNVGAFHVAAALWVPNRAGYLLVSRSCIVMGQTHQGPVLGLQHAFCLWVREPLSPGHWLLDAKIGLAVCKMLAPTSASENAFAPLLSSAP